MCFRIIFSTNFFQLLATFCIGIQCERVLGGGLFADILAIFLRFFIFNFTFITNNNENIRPETILSDMLHHFVTLLFCVG